MSSLIVLVPVLLFFGWATWAYNRMVQARNQQAEAWSGVDVQLKKRSDLVPPLVECVSAYRTHEAQTFRDAAAARQPAEVTRELRSLIAVAEAYPELKAAENFRKLMGQLVAIEDDLQYARRYYNGSVRDYRNLTESFPANLIAGIFGFQAGAFFEVESALERANPEVRL
ncbi:MAG: LemA family protein [Verrucomicrobia bacterium]|nr:LemA family protein [Verrucomicrobiota bacterium]